MNTACLLWLTTTERQARQDITRVMCCRMARMTGYGSVTSPSPISTVAKSCRELGMVYLKPNSTSFISFEGPDLGQKTKRFRWKMSTGDTRENENRRKAVTSLPSTPLVNHSSFLSFQSYSAHLELSEGGVHKLVVINGLVNILIMRHTGFQSNFLYCFFT